jgi:predicted metal-dependent hydrolase
MDAMDPPPTSPAVEVRRSRRRKRTVSAYREGDTIVVMIPARMSRTEEREWVATMVDRVTQAEQRRRPSDQDLERRAARLSRKYLDGLAAPASVRWVANQRARWGSCTPADGTIRLSQRLQGMPTYVVDYVLLHELAHLLCPGHDADFWSWLERYDLTERARGFLEGVSTASQLQPSPGSPPGLTDVGVLSDDVDEVGDRDADQPGEFEIPDAREDVQPNRSLDELPAPMLDLGILDGQRHGSSSGSRIPPG